METTTMFVKLMHLSNCKNRFQSKVQINDLHFSINENENFYIPTTNQMQNFYGNEKKNTNEKNVTLIIYYD